MCRSVGEIVLLLAARQGVVYLTPVNLELIMDEVRVLSIEDVNNLVFAAVTIPAPISVLHSVFPEILGVESEEDFYKQADIIPVPSVLLSSDSICQITNSREAMAIAKYFRGVALLMRESEEEGADDE